MAFSNSELEEIEKEMNAFLEKRRPPEEVRDRLDLSYSIDGQSIEIHDVRTMPTRHEEGTVPMQPDTKMRSPFAKATYVRSKGIWKLYWMRADLKWHSYEPLPSAGFLEEVLEEVNRDPYFCFFG